MAEVEDIRGATVRGVSWKLAAEATTQSTRLIVLLILARLLSPEEFGLAGIVLAFVVFVPVLSDLALGAALIYKPLLEEVDRSTAFWATLPLGLFFTFLTFGLSWPIADLFNAPELQPLFAVFSISFTIASLSSTQFALLTRAMNFRALELRVITGTAVGAVCAIALALAGAGPWALVAGEIVNRSVSLVLLWLQSSWRPTRCFSRDTLRRLVGYSGAILGAHLVIQFSNTLQTLLVGRILGSRAVGTLTVTQTIVLLPFNRVATPIQEVMFPALSRMQDEPERIRVAWNRVNQVVAAIAFPTLAGLAILSTEVTRVFLGPRWEGTQDVLRILSIAGMAIALQRITFSVMQARAYTRSLFWVSCLTVVMAAAAIGIGSHWGLEGTAVGLTIQAIAAQIALMIVTARSVDSTLLASVRPLLRVGLAAGLMAIAVGLLRSGLATVGVVPELRIAICAIAGALVFVPAITLLERDLVREVVGMLRAIRGKRDQPEPSP
jgi:O-antigen/teichoic acid export membrane protein